MTAKQFEDLRIWQEARIQAKSIYLHFGPNSSGYKDYGFRDQIQRCAISAMNNIAEGFERKSDPDFARFLDIAKGSNGEVRSMLYLAEDLGYLTVSDAQKLRNESTKLSRGIHSLTQHLRKILSKS